MTPHRLPLSLALVALLAALLGACTVDVGPCNESLLGGINLPGMARPHAGQVVMQSTCAAGRCHSVGAVGAARVGVPAGLNFDVVPAASTPDEFLKAKKGTDNVQGDILEIWGEVEGGSMPPEGQGTLSADDKETLRNWLACGAPVIAAPVGAVDGADPWSAVYASFELACLGCHGTESGPITGEGFLLGAPGDACGGYRNVLMRPAVTTSGGCAGTASLVVAGQPDASLLLQKIEGTQTCGMSMPLFQTPFAQTNPALAAQLRSWIASGAPPPPGCM